MKLLLINPNSNDAKTEAIRTIVKDSGLSGVKILAQTAPLGPPLILRPNALRERENAELALPSDRRKPTCEGKMIEAPGNLALRRMCSLKAFHATGIAEPESSGRQFEVRRTKREVA